MIQDVQIIDLVRHLDDRGYLIEIARMMDGPEPHGVVHRFGQVYLVGNDRRCIVRAFHRHQRLWDWFFISHGSAKFVLKDDRPDSPTCNKLVTIILSGRKPQLLVVPPGVYHGWMSLEDDTQLISIASHTYNRENPDELRISSESFGDVWTIEGR